MKKMAALLLLTALLVGCLSGCFLRTVEQGQTQDIQIVTVPAAQSETAPDAGDRLSFTTTDLEGNTVTAGDYADAKVIMVNFWEPWCGPCVGELPDLAALYENYKDRGLVILGVFNDQEADAVQLVADNGITYPILHYTEDLAAYTTMYVPTTVLFRGDGTLLTEEPLIGSREYADWEYLLLPYLEN